MDVASIKAQFPAFQVHADAGQALHYLDNAATAQKPKTVVDAICHAYTNTYGPVARGLYPLAEQATDAYENARQKVASFIGASKDEIVFTKGATESLNTIAECAVKPTLQPGDEVWVSIAEHHANFLPWMRICDATGARLKQLDIDENGKLILPPLAELKSGRVKCIALSLISNVLGYFADTAAIVEQASALGITTVVDAAQTVAHHPINMASLQCDFLAFSAHKMFGPTGIGVLYASSGKLANLPPWLVGGGMVDWVGENTASCQWTPGVQGFEAGSPNLAGAIGIAAAIDFIEGFDRLALEQHISELGVTAGNAIKALSGYQVMGDESNWQAGIVTFTHNLVHPHDIAQVCGDSGVAIRAGHHCAQPLMAHIGHLATARASFSIYNDERDLEALVMALITAEGMFT